MEQPEQETLTLSKTKGGGGKKEGKGVLQDHNLDPVTQIPPQWRPVYIQEQQNHQQQ
jgi:hypothetical protein